MRVGQDNDNYLQYVIKNKALEACLYLLNLPEGQFDMRFMNGQGNTALHLAIKTG
jgi:hypothetical protein